MTPDVDGAALLAEIEAKRGYALDMHRILAEWDPGFLQAYETLLHASSWEPRLLDRRTKELLYVAVLTAVASPAHHLRAHMEAALANGASPRELLETLELTLPPTGVPRFLAALDVWREVVREQVNPS